MSNCIKDLCDYDFIKKCCRCKNILLKSNFNRNKTKRDGVQNIGIICFKDYHINRKERRSILDEQRRKTDFNFKLISNIRTRTSNAFRSQKIKKSNETKKLIGCSNSFFKKWIIYQLYGEMMIENYGKVWCLYHCLPLSKINLSNENELYKSTNCVNLRPMYMKDNLIKGDKIDMRLYLFQEIKGTYFMKLNGKGPNEDIHQ